MRYREIISYPDMIQREQLSLQKGMNFRVRRGYSILLMSVRKGAPYQDQWHDDKNLLEYEGHDRQRQAGVNPKRVDQPLKLPSGKPTDNGKFFNAAMAHKNGQAPPEPVQVYEKIATGIWCDRGRHELVDASLVDVPAGRKNGQPHTRKVCRFFLRPTRTPGATAAADLQELSVARQIPTAVKVQVWKRDNGCCVKCGKTDNLHFDHDYPWSRGGSSITAANVQLLCARHNLQKSNKILSLGPLLGGLVAGMLADLGTGA